MVSYIFPSMETEFPLGRVFCRWIMLAAHVYWCSSEDAATSHNALSPHGAAQTDRPPSEHHGTIVSDFSRAGEDQRKAAERPS